MQELLRSVVLEAEAVRIPNIFVFNVCFSSTRATLLTLL